MPGEETSTCPATPGGTDKVGNWVNQQFQLDVFGEALQLLAVAGAADRLDAEGWRAAQAAIRAIESAGANRITGFGRSRTSGGRSPGWPAWPGCAPSQSLPAPGRS